MREAGFDTVPLPVKRSAHMSTSPPSSVDAALFDRVGWAVESGLRRGLGRGGRRVLGTTWGTDGDRARVRTDLARGSAWARRRGRPLLLGEFGVHLAARAAWTTLVRSEAERLGMSWAYGDFATDFGAFDRGSRTWREPLKSALLG